MINLAFGEVHFTAPSVIRTAIANGVMNGQLQYSYPQGEVFLLEKLCHCIIEDEEAICSKDNLIIVPGAKLGIKYVFDVLAFSGKNIAIAEPTWSYYIDMLKAVDANVYAIRYNDDFLNQLKLIDNLHAMILINPNNPDGRVWKKHELLEIQLFCERKAIYILCDEVYKEYVYTQEYITFPRLNKMIPPNVVVIRSFSKSFAMAGARIGYIVAEKKMINKICKLQHMYINNVPIFTQMGCYEGIKNRDGFLPHMRNYYFKNMMYMFNVFANTKHFKPIYPDGGLCMVVDVGSWAQDAREACLYLQRHDILCSGVAYYSDVNQDKHIRFSFCHDRSVIVQAMKKIKKIDEMLTAKN